MSCTIEKQPELPDIYYVTNYMEYNYTPLTQKFDKKRRSHLLYGKYKFC